VDATIVWDKKKVRVGRWEFKKRGTVAEEERRTNNWQRKTEKGGFPEKH